MRASRVKGRFQTAQRSRRGRPCARLVRSARACMASRRSRYNIKEAMLYWLVALKDALKSRWSSALARPTTDGDYLARQRVE